MKYRSVFDIIGPIMVGPSSSHTAGAVRIGLFARNLFNKEPKNIEITLYGSFKDTYKGHGTDIALIGGLLGFDTDDKRIRTSLKIADNKKIKYKFIESEIEHIHPNTAKIVVEGENDFLEIVGKSIGGGKMVIFEIQGFEVNISANFPILFIFFENKDSNKESLESIVKNHHTTLSYKFSSSVIEGKGLLIVEISNYLEDFVKKIEKFEYVKNIKFSKSLQ